MEEKIRISLGNGFYLTAVAEGDPNYNGIFIYIEDEKGRDCQDIACVEQEHDRYDTENKKESFSVYVYGNPETDDWTQKISGIPLKKE